MKCVENSTKIFSTKIVLRTTQNFLDMSFLRSPSAYKTSLAVTASYLLLYTAYDKQTKTLVLKNLTDLVTFKRGRNWTFLELNKAISLSGLTTMLMSFLPQFESQNRELLFISMNMLWAHSVYSFYQFYSLKVSKVLSLKFVKRISILFGSLGQLALSAGYWGFISKPALLLTSTSLGLAHFWTMEVDDEYVLQVRPYAYLPFPLGAAALYYLINGQSRSNLYEIFRTVI